MFNKVLVDVDGVLLNWDEYFHEWLNLKGSYKIKNENAYYPSDRYEIPVNTAINFVNEFNNSSWIGFLPALRDAKQGIDTLRRNGFIIECITSFSNDVYSVALREKNLKNVFGYYAFNSIICLPCSSSKYNSLSRYKDTNMFWIEDKWENIFDGLSHNLQPIILDHKYNREIEHSNVHRFSTWKEITNFILTTKQYNDP